MKSHILMMIGLVLLLSAGCSDEEVGVGGSGILEADEIIVAAETGGRVARENFREGSPVTADDTLVVIDPSRLEIQLEAARATRQAAEAHLASAEVRRQQAAESAKYARREFNRITSLVEAGTGTTARRDQVEHEMTQAELNVQTADASIRSIRAEVAKVEAEISHIERSLADCFPRAGISGVVTEKFVDRGELLAPGRPIAKISNLDYLDVKVYLPLEEFSQVRIGDSATVDTETEAGTFPGRVVWTSEEAEFTPKNIQTKKSRANLVYAVKVRVANPDGILKIGMPVFVTLSHD